MNLTGNELLYVLGSLSNGAPSGELELVSTQAIANLAGGAITLQTIYTTGSTGATAALDSFIGWNSPTTANKTQPIPTSTGSLAQIVISDIYGSAGTYPITATPISGVVVGVNQVYTAYGSITLLDTNAGWVSI